MHCAQKCHFAQCKFKAIVDLSVFAMKHAMSIPRPCSMSKSHYPRQDPISMPSAMQHASIHAMFYLLCPPHPQCRGRHSFGERGGVRTDLTYLIIA